MRVLGVDPGLSRCGVGVVDGPGHRPTAVRAGVIRTAPGDPVAERLLKLRGELLALIAETSPDAVAVERVFFNANVRTAMGVGQAAGVALLCAAEAGVPVVEYTPTQVKSAVAGSGAAEKAQVGFMVRSLLRLAETPSPPDAADALALALCHLHHGAGLGGAADAAGAGQMHPRLAAALAAAGPGAQVVRGGER
ncbi:MAG TPA: crossover junction endodeoxyribonuclease RuvC [Egibacteraceae bacterium]|nr:crossover junction endodeoxyribonuclease RuvC [Egibacteraceae bacterium]